MDTQWMGRALGALLIFHRHALVAHHLPAARLDRFLAGSAS